MELHSNILKSTQKLLQNPQNNLSRYEKYKTKTNKHVMSDHIKKIISINNKINYNLTTMHNIHATMHEMYTTVDCNCATWSNTFVKININAQEPMKRPSIFSTVQTKTAYFRSR